MSENVPIEKPPKRSLSVRIVVAFLVFVIAGSTVLVAWLQANYQRESRAQFVHLAKTNADFIRTSRLAWTERMARELGRILNVQVFFRGPSEELLPAPEGKVAEATQSLCGLSAERGVVILAEKFEAIAVPVDEHRALILMRTGAPGRHVLFRASTLVALGVFWAFTLALALALTRGIVRPLRMLASRLPQIGDDVQASLPGAERGDEIGSLARAYLDTHAQLLDERARREKSERLALLGRMATGLAHEIHNPLSAIRMHAQLLETAGPSEIADVAAESLPVLLGETAKIESLVNQWMFLARPEPPQTSHANVADLIAGIVTTMRAHAMHARVEIVNEIPRGLFVAADARRLSQALGNIVMNAIQAMPGGGTLRIGGEARGGTVAVVFEDTGRGFSENALMHFADLFYSEKEGGMGIGLSVSSEIVRAHGGTLRVANRPVGGAVVTIELPALST